ncbi:MAG: hypothetical protein JRK53_08635 [Deltaproteobacteria bacterium]|nr:hypothetical protein [Deltaproteobacteria bacterium]
MKAGRRKKRVIILLIATALVVAAAIVIPRLIDPNRYHDLIVSELEKSVGGKIRLGPITWGFGNGIRFSVDGFSVYGARAFPLDVDLTRISGNISITPLFSKKVVVENLEVKDPLVVVRLEPEPRKEAALTESAPPAAGVDPKTGPAPESNGAKG